MEPAGATPAGHCSGAIRARVVRKVKANAAGPGARPCNETPQERAPDAMACAGSADRLESYFANTSFSGS